jgi:hypothetical protein
MQHPRTLDPFEHTNQSRRRGHLYLLLLVAAIAATLAPGIARADTLAVGDVHWLPSSGAIAVTVTASGPHSMAIRARPLPRRVHERTSLRGLRSRRDRERTGGAAARKPARPRSDRPLLPLRLDGRRNGQVGAHYEQLVTVPRPTRPDRDRRRRHNASH